MRTKLFDPAVSGKRMTVVCFVSGSGTNYARIVEADPQHNYFVFTNRPGCKAAGIAATNGHEVISLSHVPYLRAAREAYGPGRVPRNCRERLEYEQDVATAIEERLGKKPDLICLAGYDQWMTDWMVDRYSPRMLNVHPGDTTKGYYGLHWIPTARAIIAGDTTIKSTLFVVDRGEDTGPVLVQSRPLDIAEALSKPSATESGGLSEGLTGLAAFARALGADTYDRFMETAGPEQKNMMKLVCEELQGALKVSGDWQIYPFGVHELVGRGRVEIESGTIYVDGRQMPRHGYPMEQPPRA
jgi:phosphoribosylglycinamide formyltransferase-1